MPKSARFPSRAISNYTIVTSSEFRSVRQKADETFRAGADEIVLWPLSNGRAIDNFRRFHETVLKKMR